MKTILFAVLAVITSASVAAAAAPKLDLNDVTWLWPAPNSAFDLDQVISIESLKSADGNPVWSDQQFEDVLATADSDFTKIGDRRIKLPAEVRNKKVWKIAALRADPSAPGAHEVIRKNFGERPQLRLILQPVTIAGDRIQVQDIAVHLVYTFFLTQDGATTETADKKRFEEVVHDLDALKQIVEGAGVKTTGRPLGVHPGLTAKVPALKDRLADFLSKHLQAKDLNAMALMGLDGPEPWIFVAISKGKTGRFGPIPFLPARMLSFRSGKGEVLPPPRVNNLNPITNSPVLPENDQDRRGVATAVMFNDSTFKPEDFAIVGKSEKGDVVVDQKIRNRDIPDIIADPIRSHFFNTDCLSCHTETRRRMRFNLKPGEFAFRLGGQPPKIDTKFLPKHDWNVRNLGWFPPSKFIGGGPTVATVTQRTANETAEVVAFIEAHYRTSQPAAPAKAASSPAAKTRSAESAPLDKVTFLDQGWSEDERQDFYFLGQGSQLVPYSWFVSFELPDSNELFRSDRHMRSLGFIPEQPDDQRNPDGLPVGFVKDSSPTEILKKSGFLGANFKAEHFPRTDDWLGFTCAACHTAELTHKGQVIRIDGGAAMADMEVFLAGLAKSMKATVDDKDKFNRFKERIRKHAEGNIDTTGLRRELESYTAVIDTLVERNKSQHAYGMGRLDAFGAILNQICEAALHIPENRRPSSAPVSYPFLWDTAQLDWVQWNSSVEVPIARNVGEVLGVFGHATLTGNPETGQFSSTARIDYLARLETQLSRLRAPAWPAEIFGDIDRDKAEAGRNLFADNCAHCHNQRDDAGNFEMTEPNEFNKSFIRTTSVPFNVIGTDRQMVINFITRTAKPGDLKRLVKLDPEDAATKSQLRHIDEFRAAAGLPKADFSVEVPAASLLAAAVSGVIERGLSDELRNQTDEDKKRILLELRGYRSGNTPPNGGAGYKARPLNGVWATAPFGHAGAVPNLYQWLLPEDKRVKSFYVGNREFDSKLVGFVTDQSPGAFQFKTENDDGTPIPGNSNKGHSGPGKTEFSDEQRWQIIEYIKSLR
jgi:hypothetical protein